MQYDVEPSEKVCFLYYMKGKGYCSAFLSKNVVYTNMTLFMALD